MNDLIREHQNKRTTLSEKEIKEKVDSLKEELESSGALPKSPQVPPAKPRGRPRKNSNPNVDNIPKQAPEQMSKPAIPDRPQESMEDKLRRRRLVKQLRFLCNRFSEIVGNDLSGFNPHTCSLESLEKVVEEIKLAVSDTLEENTLPNWVDNGLESLENVAFSAISAPGVLQKYPGLSKLLLFRGIGTVASKDPLIQADLALIASDFISLIPSSPYVRLGMNLAKVAMGVVKYNAQMLGKMPSSVPISEEFKDF